MKKNNLFLIFISLSLILFTFACGNSDQANNNNQVNNTQENQASSSENNTQENINLKGFSCQSQYNPDDIEETWAVMYQKTAEELNSWLILNASTIESDNLEESCNKIAKNLENLTKEGLFKINYSLDPDNQNTYLLCGETKNKPNECSLISTLKVDQNIDKTFQKITQPLFDKSKKVQNTTGGTSISYSSQEVTNYVDVTSHL